MPILKAIDNPGKSLGTAINYADKDRKKENDDTLFFGINCADNADIASYQMQKLKSFIIKPMAGNISIMYYLSQPTK